MKTKVLLDTNFIMIPAKFKVDIYSELNRIILEPFELYVLDKSLIELDNIIKLQKGKEREAARLAKAILKAKIKLGKAKLISASEVAEKPKALKTTSMDYVDRIILGLRGFIVATNDKELRLKLKKEGVRTILLRQRKYLVLD